MKFLDRTVEEFRQGVIDKATFIKKMYEMHHATFFDYAKYIPKTNIKKIEIEDAKVIMTSRDRGVRIACSPGDFRIAPIETLNFLDYEKEEAMMMENLVADGSNFFDIGANIGWYSINIAVAKRLTKVYCFEPIPDTFRHLKNNLSLNSVSNIEANNFGFSNQEGEFSFYYYPEGSGNASSANLTERDDVKVVPCKVRTLDSYVEDVGVHVDFIKCDVEGAELLVFQGGMRTISQDRPIVFSEILRKWSAKFEYDPNEIFDLFFREGYMAFTAKNGLLSRFFRMDEETVETNFFFLHKEKHAELIRQYASDALLA